MADNSRSESDQQEKEYWPRIKAKYDQMLEPKKQKELNLMDQFEHAFVAQKKKMAEEESKGEEREELLLDHREASLAIFRLVVFSHLSEIRKA